MKNEYKNVFIFKNGHLGDMLLIIPALLKIRATHSTSNIHLITHRTSRQNHVTAKDVFEGSNLIDSIIFYQSTLKSFLSLALKLRKFQSKFLYYLITDRSRTLLIRDYIFFRHFARFKSLQGFSNQIIPSPIFVNNVLVHLNPEYQMAQDKILSTENSGKPPYLYPDEKTKIRIDALLTSVPFEAKLIALGPGTKMPAKKWPVERFIAVANSLLEQIPTVHFLIFGGKEDYFDGEKIRNSLEPGFATNLAGQIDIIGSAEALCRTELYIGNDSGAMHLAASMGKPCVAVFSARDNPGRWEPFGKDNTILRKRISCEGCLLEVCVHPRVLCLLEISVEEVVQAALRYFK